MTTQQILTALGPLAQLYSEPAITEIMVDDPEHVIVERNGKLENTDIRFDPPEALRTVIDEILALGGLKLGPGETIGDIRFPDNLARALAVLPPTAINGPYLVIRKMYTHSVTWEMIIKWGAMTQEAKDLLQSALCAQMNILVAGGTSSGKYTLTSRLAELIPSDERLVIVEAIHEYQINHPRAVYLEAGAAGMSMNDLLNAATKMRPDWLIVGELTGPETIRVLELLRTGHTVLTNMHADNIQDILARLENNCLMANLGLGLSEIRNIIASALQVFVYQKRMPNGSRRVTDIVELRGLENDRYVLQPLMRYNPETDKLEATGVKPGWV
jgi:pilus assembly protein CpaF